MEDSRKMIKLSIEYDKEIIKKTNYATTPGLHNYFMLIILPLIYPAHKIF